MKKSYTFVSFAFALAIGILLFQSSILGLTPTGGGTHTKTWNVGDKNHVAGSGINSVTNPTSSAIRGTITSKGPDKSITIQVYGPPSEGHPQGEKIGELQNLDPDAIIEIPPGGRAEAEDISTEPDPHDVIDSDTDGAGGDFVYEFVV